LPTLPPRPLTFDCSWTICSMDCAQRAKIQAAEEKMVEERARSLPNGYEKLKGKRAC
jgi:hypothetical protein